MNAKLTKEYHARIVLPNGLICELTAGENPNQVKDFITKMLSGRVKITPETIGIGTTLIFSGDIGGGNVPCGWVVGYEVPEHLSNRVLAEKVAA